MRIGSGGRFVTGLERGAPRFLHAGLEYVPLTVLQFCSHSALVGTELRPVTIVEFLDDLKRPPARQHVAADEFGLKPAGHGAVSGRVELVARLAQQQVGMADELMERVEVTAGPFDELEGFGDLADSADGVVGQSHAALARVLR